MNLISKNRFDDIIGRFSKLESILVVGDVGIDKYTQGVVSRISPEAPVPILEVNKEWEILGLASNISNNYAALGIDSTLCGVVGNDSKASLFENLLEKRGLKTWGIVRDSERPTIFKERITTATQQICRIDYENSKEINEQTATTIIKRAHDFCKEHGAVIIEDYSKGTLPKKVIESIIKCYRDAGHLVAIDPGRGTNPLWYKGATLLKPNLAEAKLMVETLGYKYSDKTVKEMATILADKLSLEQLVITLGGDGMALMSTNKTENFKIIPTFAAEVFDVSGAGDTTISLLVSSLLAKASLEEAAWIANCGAGVVVAKMGTATVNIKELQKFYEKLKDIKDD